MEQALTPGQDKKTLEWDGDSVLIRCLRTQDAEAFIALYDLFNRRVFRFLIHMTGSLHESEELLQAVFASVWEGMASGMFERFDADRGTLEGYLLGVARNAARKLIARRNLKVSIDQFEFLHGALELSAAAAGLAAVEARFEMQRLSEAILHLPVEYREAITLCCLHDLSYEQAAKVMKCSLGTVGSRVNRGKVLLRKTLSRYCDVQDMASTVKTG